MKKLILVPYKMGSQGAKNLAESLGCLRVRQDSHTFVATNRHVPILWGVSNNPPWLHGNDLFVVNPVHAISRTTNKLETLQHLLECGVSIPEFTTNRVKAQKWCDEGKTVVARKVLRGHGGVGITLHRAGDIVCDAPLYTIHVRHKDEYRVHVVNNRVIHVQQKRKSGDHPDPDPLIRNHDNGWVFCQKEVDCPLEVQKTAVKAVEMLGLDFGAVDIGYRVKEGNPYVFEVNTAPGLEGTTITKYADALKGYL